MASPRVIISRLKSVSPISHKTSLNLSNLVSPKSPKSNETYLSLPENKNQLSPFNVNTPNRKRILENGLSQNHHMVLGTGAFSTVYKALYKGTPVAAKIMQKCRHSDTIIDSEKHASLLRHSNIVKILCIEKGTALSLITMELCGTTLQDELEETVFDKKTQVLIWRAIAHALQFCHNAGVIHGDVKAKNILIGNSGQPKLTDFGSSILINESGEEQRPQILRSTPGYAAPEVLRGNTPTPAGDIYSLGVVAWQILSRKVPFAGLHVHSIIYLSVKGIRPADEDLSDNFHGEYKLLYRQMWSQEVTFRPSLSEIISTLDILMKE